MKRKIALICFTVCAMVALVACGNVAGTDNTKTQATSSAETEDQVKSTDETTISESSDEISQESFERLAAENKELWSQIIALQYEEHKREGYETQEPDLEYFANNEKRHQEMAEAFAIIQDVNAGHADYEDLIGYSTPVHIFTDIEVADFEEVSDEDMAEAIAEVRNQNAALKSLIDAMSH